MKIKIAIAAFFAVAAFLTPAHAAPVLLTTTLSPTGVLGTTHNFNLSSSGPAGSNGYIVASGFTNLFPGSGVNPPTFPATAAKLDVATDAGGVTGLGVTGTHTPYIGPTDGIVLDLSHISASQGGMPLYKVTFDLYKDVTGGSYWVIYGKTGSGSTASYHLVASGQMSATGFMAVSTGLIYSSYVVGLGGDCAFDIRDVQFDYEAPEPGTFAMLGIGAVAVLVFRKRLTGRRG